MHGDLLHRTGMALLMAFGMFWKTGWTLVLGFTISATLQSIVPAEEMRKRLGKGGARQTALAAILGAASSSCSYASAAIMRTLFKKGAALTPTIAFLIASTNLVLELGVILYLLLGGAFTAAEWIGGVVMIVIMSLIVKATYPKALAEHARTHTEQGKGHEHHVMVVEGDTWRERLANPQARIRTAQNFAMEWDMLWKDLAIGFLVGGFLSEFVPTSVWQSLFLTDAPGWLRVPANAIIGPVVAMLTFVCSIGNVPLAAVLWGGGATFGGVIAFLYADLIVLPLLDAYRRYFGWKFAAYLGVVLFAAMALAAIVIDLIFSGLGWLPDKTTNIRDTLTHFALDYTFWLNCIALVVAVIWFWVNRKHPMDHSCH